MRITTDWVCHDGRLGYLAWPERAATPLPAVLVIQEIWGVDTHIQDVTVRLASAGYAAFALDLYATNGRRPESMTVERIAEVQAFTNTLPRTAWANPAERDAELAKLPEAPAHADRGDLQGAVRRNRVSRPVCAASRGRNGLPAPELPRGIQKVIAGIVEGLRKDARPRLARSHRQIWPGIRGLVAAIRSGLQFR
jgi:hypothetical protein